MAFIVEDGTGIPGANSYTSVEFANEYFEEVGNTDWPEADDGKEAWLVQATRYIDTVFGARFIGDKTLVATQGLLWPRTFCGVSYVAPDYRAGVPIVLQQACAEYALRAQKGPLMPDPTVDANGFATVVTKKVIGPIEKDFQVMGSSSRVPLFRSYPAADMLMRTLLVPGGGTRTIR